ncbi:hypothetical protein [Curtobacterium sp. MCBD17_040]|uniref:hypothetical protein n=1 Tax=Curtobacterium sp. MCBD17_040 TaxID=2175674 RepID=UPI000DA861A9|nr:hypothetical protein [Curtobacterium sp. MCBD17_040]WIB65906.1 hypothetical protein DEI94_17475 [Curtobacterium sp. MCBD17_040]
MRRFFRTDRGATDPILVIATIAVSLILLLGGTVAAASLKNSANITAATNDLNTVALAEASWNTAYGTFISYSDLGDTTLEHGTVTLHPLFHTVVNAGACGWVAAAVVPGGPILIRTSATSAVAPAPAPTLTIPSCFPSNAITDVVSSAQIQPLGAGRWRTVAGAYNVQGDVNGTGAAAQFSEPESVAVGPDGSIYIADQGNYQVRKMTQAGAVTTYAGVGTSVTGSTDSSTALQASFYVPYDIQADGAGNVYVTELNNRHIRKIAPNGGATSTITGAQKDGYVDGVGTAMAAGPIYGSTIGPDGNFYFADSTHPAVREVTPDGFTATVIGNPVGAIPVGSASGTTFAAQDPTDVTFDENGDMWIVDSTGNTIWESTGGPPTIVAGNGTNADLDGSGTSAEFATPTNIVSDPAADAVIVSDSSGYGSLRMINIKTKAVTTLNDTDASDQFGDAWNTVGGMAIDAAGNLWAADPVYGRIIEEGLPR